MNSFLNIVMELKKCCNHASLIRPIDTPLAAPDPLQVIEGNYQWLIQWDVLNPVGSVGWVAVYCARGHRFDTPGRTNIQRDVLNPVGSVGWVAVYCAGGHKFDTPGRTNIQGLDIFEE